MGLNMLGAVTSLMDCHVRGAELLLSSFQKPYEEMQKSSQRTAAGNVFMFAYIWNTPKYRKLNDS